MTMGCINLSRRPIVPVLNSELIFWCDFEVVADSAVIECLYRWLA